MSACLLLVLTSLAADPDPADPARLPPPPAGAAGYPSRDPALDARAGFREPPPGYGEVAFYWWLGDPLTRERLTWQLDRLAEVRGVSGLQVNYAHSDRGGQSYGLTFPSEPPLFSERWWDLFRWFTAEARKRGMATSLSDYTLGTPGQGYWTDEVLREDPARHGWNLHAEARDLAGGGDIAWEFAERPLAVQAYPVAGDTLTPPGVDLAPRLAGTALRWTAPAGPGRWKVVAVSARAVPRSLDPMRPESGAKVIEKFFQRFADRLPGEAGRGLNFFFSDELDFGVRGHLWNSRFAAEFRKRKGYDLVPELPALFHDAGPRTPKVRLDYWDVLVSLSEENFFRPVFRWHYDRGMLYGCDHGGRGRDVTEFGDYFRTQRWMTGPGNDQPGLAADAVKNKVASSISHLYDRPRTWLEGYYGSGWGTTPAQLTDATFRNFVQGHNLLTLHGLYYATHGGWWEWAPPCNHFRMPYWSHLPPFFACAKRLSYLMSQGRHRCDAAVVYPVEPVQAGTGGAEAVEAAFGAVQHLVERGIDADFLDADSLGRARVEGRELTVAGERYRVLVLPGLRTCRHSTLAQAAAFWRAGGIVVALGALPEASDRAGRDDPEVAALVREVFGATARAAAPAEPRRNAAGGLGLVARAAGEIEAVFGREFPRDFALVSPGPGTGDKAARPQVLHRRVGPREVYLVHGAPRHSECFFRAGGPVELWDPWTGEARPLHVLSRTKDGTTVRLPGEATDAQVVVFAPGETGPAVARTDLDDVTALTRAGDEVRVRGLTRTGGRVTAEVRDGPRSAALAATVPAPPPALALDGPWEFETIPALDNRFGDFHWPPTPTKVGPEARRLRYADETAARPGWQEPGFDDRRWPLVTCSFGPRFWKLGPLPGAADPALEERLAALTAVDPAVPVTVNGQSYRWQPYDFSLRWGVEGDPGHQGYHGLKEEVPDEFLALGRRRFTATGSAYDREEAGPRYYLWTSVVADREGPGRLATGGHRPAAAWLGGKKLDGLAGAVTLRAGANPLLLRYDGPGRGYAVVRRGSGSASSPDEGEVFSPAAAWVWVPGEKLAGSRYFRRAFPLDAPPAKARLRVTCDNAYTALVNGREVGRGTAWERVQEYDVGALLRPGQNVLAVAARNDGGEAGLIAELVLAPAKGPTRRLATDASWRWSREPAAGWLNADFDDAAWGGCETLGSFLDSLWGRHQHGPPRLDEPPPQPASAAVPKPLAMRWLTDAAMLPFDARPGVARPAGWYRFTAPPGLRGLTLVARGTPQGWAGGRPLRVEPLPARPDGARAYRLSVPEPAPDPVVVALRLEQERGCYGGSAIPEPITLDCGPGRLPPGDWARIDGLSAYSGHARYSRTVTLDAARAGLPATLDLGAVAASAEVRLNGQAVATKVAPPWRVDLIGRLRAGDNRLEVIVANTLANHYQTVPTRYRGSPVSGLLGPVRVEFAAPVELTGRFAPARRD